MNGAVTRRTLRARRAGRVAAITHVLWFAISALAVLIRHDEYAELVVWAGLTVLDLPVGYLFVVAIEVIPGMHHAVVWCSAFVVFGVLGTIQWYGIVRGITWLVNLRQTATLAPPPPTDDRNT